MVWASGGGLMGLRVTGLSGWDRAYQKEASPATYMSIELNILTLEMSGVDRRPAKEGEEVGAIQINFLCVHTIWSPCMG